jgi:hypothetical protein
VLLLISVFISYRLIITNKVEYETIERAVAIKVVLDKSQSNLNNEKSQTAFDGMRTIHWYDLNWSKDIAPINDTMTTTGKFHVFAEWPETVNKPEVSFLNIGIPDPVFIRAGSWIGGQLIPHFDSTELSDTYGFFVNSSGSDSTIKAYIAFNKPKKMELGKEYEIFLKLSLKKTIAELKAAIRSQDEKQGDKIDVAERMEATLQGVAFTINPTTKSQIGIISNQVNSWQWQVTPNKKGQHSLYLNIAPIMKLDGTDTTTTLRDSYQYIIDVDVTYFQQLKDFILDNNDLAAGIKATVVFVISAVVWLLNKFLKKAYPKHI